jgi:hypothetical protein
MDTVLLPASEDALERAMTGSERKRRRFYVGVALFMTAIVVSGFWRTYFGPLLRGTMERPWIFHLHTLVFMGWMILLLAQVTLVSLGRTRIHRKLGKIGIAYGFVVLAVGLVMTFTAPLLHLAAGDQKMDEAAGLLLLPLGDMVLFAGFFTAAIVYRPKPEIHKRLILLATVALLFPAVARLAFERPWIFLVIWLSPILVAMGHDVLIRRRVHPTYLIGTGILIVAFTRVFFMHSDPWLKIGRAALTALMRDGV